jgi:outer membrane protein OmpA-like peptidoglycan-associated protein
MVTFKNAPKPGEEEPNNPPAGNSGKTGIILGAIAVALVLILGYFILTSSRRLERQMSALNQQTEDFRHQIQLLEEKSTASAQQASQAAASAQAAAQQRDQAKEAQEQADAQAQAALQQASDAEQKAEEYRKQHEAELAQLQETLGQIAETRRTSFGLVMTLGEKSIRFDFDQSDVKPQYRDVLNRIAGILMTLKGYSIYVYGYTDDVGTKEYNLKLSERRAQAVRDVLVQAGITSRIETKGFGESDPRVPGDTPQAHAANRRVEIGLVYATIGGILGRPDSQK